MLSIKSRVLSRSIRKLFLYASILVLIVILENSVGPAHASPSVQIESNVTITVSICSPGCLMVTIPAGTGGYLLNANTAAGVTVSITAPATTPDGSMVFTSWQDGLSNPTSPTYTLSNSGPTSLTIVATYAAASPSVPLSTACVDPLTTLGCSSGIPNSIILLVVIAVLATVVGLSARRKSHGRPAGV